MSDQTAKADGGKSNPLLLFQGLPRALAAVTRVLDYGAQKYEAHSWKGVEPERYDAAGRRHQSARDLNEILDDESGLLHLAHEATNVLFQLEMFLEEHNMDPRDWKFHEPPQDHKET